jgi:8-oxo-dGTP pyrophosphatase MutT (NUDIX family)
MSIQPWESCGSKFVGDFRIFTLHSEYRKSPRTGITHDFYVLRTIDWVNVIALTPDDKIVMVEQYRHGSETVELEIPGGLMDKEDKNPIQTGIRELREETGYAGEEPELIGGIFANPAILNNTCHTVLIRNCVLSQKTELDSGEDIETKLVPVKEIPRYIYEGKIKHSLVVVALYHHELWQRFKGK